MLRLFRWFKSLWKKPKDWRDEWPVYCEAWYGKTWLDFMKFMRDEMFLNNIPDDKNRRPAGNGQFKRWLDSGAILINGSKVKSDGRIEWPITSLVLFPNNEKRTITILTTDKGEG